MNNFKEELLKDKTVSLWGVGYLGYTMLVWLQSKGFRANINDITNTGFDSKSRKGAYPDKEQLYSWSENSDVPKLELTKIKNCSKSSMFGSRVHMLSFPPIDRNGNNRLRQLADVFVKHAENLEGALIVFNSFASPGFIDKNFINVLKEHKVKCSFASAFRSDWSVEEFLYKHNSVVLAANDTKSIEKAEILYKILDKKYKTLASIKEAEIYENAKNSFQYMTTSFINQLALAYPDTNVKKMTKYLLNDVELDESHLCIGSGGYKTASSVQNILEGSKNPNFLSLVKEAHQMNLSTVLQYSEIMKKHGIKGVTILGLSVKGNQKNIEMSPSVILSECLNKLNIEVYIDDPSYSRSSLAKVLPSAFYIDILKGGMRGEALFVMTNHNKYKYITSNDIKALGMDKASVIIDNVGLFRNFHFPQSVVYHTIGDGKLDLI